MTAVESARNPVFDTLVNLISGAAGGLACVACGQPFDTVKVKLQTFPSLYHGFTHCFLRTYHQEGLAGLYRGSTAALASNVAENGVLFASYGTCQELTKRVLGLRTVTELSELQNAAAGSVASCFSSLVLCPTELVKCRLQALHEMQAVGKCSLAFCVSSWSIAKNILKNEGPWGFFQGMTSTWLREVPGYFCFFGGYEFSKTIFIKCGYTKNELGAGPLVVSGGIGGAFFWIAVYPIDSVKSRIQVLSLSGKQAGFFSTMISIIRAEGAPVLYVGLTPTVIRAFPSNGVLFLTYELTRRSLTNQVSLG